MTIREQAQYKREYNARVCKELGINSVEYANFRHLGAKLNKIFQNQCNGYVVTPDFGWDDKAEAFDLQDEKKLVKKARELAKAKGLKIFFQTDPRGATIYLDKKPISDTSYNNAFCIY